MTLHTTLPTDALIHIAPQLALCPACGTKQLVAEVTGWREDRQGRLTASEVRLACETEPLVAPDLEAAHRDWQAFHATVGPGVWYRLEREVLQWIQAHYRFEEEL